MILLNIYLAGLIGASVIWFFCLALVLYTIDKYPDLVHEAEEESGFYVKEIFTIKGLWKGYYEVAIKWPVWATVLIIGIFTP